MDHGAGAKDSAYTPQMGALILARIEAGETVKQITADPRMPSYATVYRWTHVIEEFGEAWRELRQRLGADAIWADRQRAVAIAWRRPHERRLAGKPPRDWVCGRRSTYTPQMAGEICWRIGEGASLSEVVARPGMPSFKAIYRWLKRFPEFRAAYVEACAVREMLLEDLAVDASLRWGPVSLAVAKAKVAALRGKAGRTRPKKYRALPPEEAAAFLAGINLPTGG
jgi:hypothetical protein